jgi:SAM-dependent methyltransferase
MQTLNATATDVQLATEIAPTPARVVERYVRSQDWQLFEKEFVYHKFAPDGKTWVDFGCGTGEITTQLAILGATRVIAIDVVPGLVEMTQQRAILDHVDDRVTVLCDEIQHLRPEPVDIVLSFAVLHHMADTLAEVIPIIKSWIKPGGAFICVEPISYSRTVDWLRNHCGFPFQPLDSGERKLTEDDLRLIQSNFASSERTHFRVFSRLDKLYPNAARLFRKVDRTLLALHPVAHFAGTVVLTCFVD